MKMFQWSYNNSNLHIKSVRQTDGNASTDHNLYFCLQIKPHEINYEAWVKLTETGIISMRCDLVVER